ncbi:MAG: hypothetical protein OXT67_02135, partial [Zetaproteobacteria bacterium]|nr:hypothetical protein [Zetaproteobacteria bacterium]
LNEALRICANNQEQDQLWQKKEGGKIHAHFTWEEVKTKLERSAEAKGHRSMAIVDDLRRWTTSFDKTGSLGFLFNAREEAESLSDSTQLIVYDLDDIQDERLKNIAAQLVAMKVTRDIKKFDLSLTKLVQFEELGVYLEGENEKTEAMANRFVMNITKTIRKMNGIPFGITNAVEDFFQKKGGKSFWKQATQKIFLPFTSDMVSSLEQGVKNGDIKLTEADIDIIRNLHIKDGAYSQAYIVSENTGYKAVIDMPLSPTLYALLNTSPSQNARYQNLRKLGHSAAEAINQLADEFAKQRRQT